MYHDNKAQVLETYNSNGKPTTANIKRTDAVTEFSAVVCAKTAVTAAKTLEQFSRELDEVFKIHMSAVDESKLQQIGNR